MQNNEMNDALHIRELKWCATCQVVTHIADERLSLFSLVGITFKLSMNMTYTQQT